MPKCWSARCDGVEVRPQLSARQAEILHLLMVGKANKDIAGELGIGVGTVKQHIVALFKKLNVSTRAMAIARGHSLEAKRPMPAAQMAESAMELRPTTVLSLSLELTEAEETVRMEAWTRLQAACSKSTEMLDAALVGRPALISVDIIFGIYRVYEDNAARAFHVARAVASALADQPSYVLRMGAASGYLIASMHRHGGWTGETVVGRTIAAARDLRDQAKPNHLLSDSGSWQLFAFAKRAEGRRIPAAEARTELPLRTAPASFLPPPSSTKSLLVGRAAERQRLKEISRRLETGCGALVWIEGESGMGKTTLCHAFAQDCLDRGYKWIEARCERVGNACYRSLEAALGLPSSPNAQSADRIAARLGEKAAEWPIVVMVDDLHLADEITIEVIRRVALLSQSTPLLLLGVGRSTRHPLLGTLPADETLRLSHMPPTDIKALVRAGAEGLSESEISTIARRAAGVPLFAAELARQAAGSGNQTPGNAPLPLTLVTLVLSRLDGLKLDRSLLAAAARLDSTPFSELAAHWLGGDADLERELKAAVDCGILCVSASGGRKEISFHHPLLVEVLRQVMLGEQLVALKEFLLTSA